MELAGEIDRRVDAVAKIGALREDARSSCVEEDLRQWVTERIALEHPELVEACERHMARHWERKNEERLEKQEERQAGRDGDAGKTVDDGHSRNAFGKRLGNPVVSGSTPY